ncbi:MAG: glycosyltransferase family 10 [Planctomycetota bacterium]
MQPPPPSDRPPDPIRVKFIMKHPITVVSAWRRQMPDAEPRFGRCVFSFDHTSRDYDWLVVYDELPPEGEALACAREHSLLITSEPSSIKVYGSAYLQQFGAVLTSHEPWAMKHPNLIRRMPCLFWFYGRPTTAPGHTKTLDELAAMPPQAKDLLISAACSNKRMGHTLHKARYDFVQAVKDAIPEMGVFGHGMQEMNDKAESLDRYRYHLALENHWAPHHITEKLTDAYLGGVLPFYFGAPNAAEYFPEDSFIPIDIRKPSESIAIIRQAITDNAFEKRQGALAEAKRRTLEEHNLFVVLAQEIERMDTGKRGSGGNRLINRRVFRKRNPIRAIGYLVERYRVQAQTRRAMHG